jgi:hypothetical protein
VQGQLRGQALICGIHSACAQTGRRIHLQVDSELNFLDVGASAEPRVCLPLVDFEKLEDLGIIDRF